MWLASFNPLHCGAVVASRRHRTTFPHPLCIVSIPFIAGQWSLHIQWLQGNLTEVSVSIPFIAGQWSLQKVGGQRWPPRGPGFNPLHCGAVVASRRRPPRTGGRQEVSIPFIAGQWSLRNAQFDVGGPILLCFNPLHCGAVVASGHAPSRIGRAQLCFNPLHCGAVVASVSVRRSVRSREEVSIPFIAGQWSLPS